MQILTDSPPATEFTEQDFSNLAQSRWMAQMKRRGEVPDYAFLEKYKDVPPEPEIPGEIRSPFGLMLAEQRMLAFVWKYGTLSPENIQRVATLLKERCSSSPLYAAQAASDPKYWERLADSSPMVF